MQCDICSRPGSTLLPLNCSTCARNALYEPRLFYVQTLLQKETLGKDVERVLTAGKVTDISTPIQQKLRDADQLAPSQYLLENLHSRRIESSDRIGSILSHVETLREETKRIKSEIATRKTALRKKRTAITYAKKELLQQQSIATEPIQKSIAKIEHRWKALRQMSAESRVFLCKEAANLFSLQQRKRRKDAAGRDSYSIGGVPIVDLRDINNADPAQITVSVTHLAYLIHLTSHYLSLRLPAEISLPNTSHPYATISSPNSSYTKPSLPIASLAKSSSTSSSQETHPTIRNPTRPRSLLLEKPLPTLAREEPINYSLFVDGVTLLAWDIAWVCKTQGLDVGIKNWEDVCAMGRNIWLLFVSPPPHLLPPLAPPAPSRTPSSTSVTPLKTTKVAPPASTPSPIICRTSGSPSQASSNRSLQPTLGHYSHTSAYPPTFLAGAQGAEYMRAWKLANPIRIIEKIKSALASERMGAEWEMVADGDWVEDDVGGGFGNDGGTAIGAATGGEGTRKSESGNGDAGTTSGTSGWTKLKSRNGAGE